MAKKKAARSSNRPKPDQITIRLEGSRERLEALAARERRPLGDWMRIMVDRAVDAGLAKEKP